MNNKGEYKKNTKLNMLIIKRLQLYLHFSGRLFEKITHFSGRLFGANVHFSGRLSNFLPRNFKKLYNFI